MLHLNFNVEYIEVIFTSFLYSPFTTVQCTEVRFVSFLSSGFITAIVVNPQERKLAKRRSVQLF